MKDCKTIHSLLSLYQENELSPRDRGKVETHLKSCVTARREMEKLGRLHDVLKGQPEPEMPSNLHDKIMARVRGNVVPLPSSRGFWTKASWTLATAAVMAFLFLNQYNDWGDFRKGPSHVSRDESAPVRITGKASEAKVPLNAPVVAQAPPMARAKQKQPTSESFADNLRSDDRETSGNFAGAAANKDESSTKSVRAAARKPSTTAASTTSTFYNTPAEATAVAGANPASPAPFAAESRSNELDQVAKKSEQKEAPAAALSTSPGYSAGMKTLKISQEKLAQSWSGDNDTSTVEREDVLDSAEAFNQAWKTFHPQEDAPGIDFTKNSVALLQAGQKPTSGYSIHVTHLEENEDQVYIWYRVDSPQAESVVTQMITHPWTLQVIPKSSKPVVFQKE